jgi:hypothetical protein
LSSPWAWYVVGHHLNSDHAARFFVTELWPRPSSEQLSSWIIRWGTGEETSSCYEDGAKLEKCARVIRDANQGVQFPQTNSTFSAALATIVPVCPGSGWALLGELDKFVSVSRARFSSVECIPRSAEKLSGGIRCRVSGAPGETVRVVFAQPDSTSLSPSVIRVRTVPLQSHFAVLEMAHEAWESERLPTTVSLA